MAKEKAKSGRPDREGKVAMTTRVSPRARKIYKVLAAELDKTMEELQVVALLVFLENFRVRSEWQASWERLSKSANYDDGAAAAD
jgi:hypothetical protein